ncbi:TetR/AcrR family transcriptional regulator [Asanoa sp. NPDC049573]|uniref:TetR/AcrR family transcriptional regulator n=1 Tax=Asanoa sp. NPDC049573 TaxID=3155396 RepID=UPI003425446D
MPPPPRQAGLVWTRPAPTRRDRTALSRDRIVRAAIALADAHGFAAISMRRLAAELDAGTMSLYRHVQDKDELADLMVDEVYAAMVPPEAASSRWAENVRAIARRTRLVMLEHPWFTTLAITRPPIGPNALAYLDSSLSAVRGAGLELPEASRLLGTVTSFVIGVVAAELADSEPRDQAGAGGPAWQETVAPYMRDMMATGRFPSLAQLITQDHDDEDPDDQFEFGLDCLIAGIAARTGRDTRP